MKKAKFVRACYGRGYDAHMVYIDYEYRGHEYTVCENRAKGNSPLAWQHRSEQARIDQLVEQEERDKNAEQDLCRYEDTADYVFEQFSRFLDGESSDFEC